MGKKIILKGQISPSSGYDILVFINTKNKIEIAIKYFTSFQPPGRRELPLM